MNSKSQVLITLFSLLSGSFLLTSPVNASNCAPTGVGCSPLSTQGTAIKRVQNPAIYAQSQSLKMVLDANNGQGNPYLYPTLQTSNPNHLWEFVPLRNGYYMIISKENGYALDANINKGDLYLNPKPNRLNLNQHWRLSEVGEYSMLISRVKGYALDANGGNGKLYLSSQPRQDNKNQLWKVVDVNGYKAMGSALATGNSGQNTTSQSTSLNLVLDANRGQGNLYLYPSLQTSNPNHLWEFVQMGNGYYMIISKDNGYALDANTNKGDLYLNPKPNRLNFNQHWRLSQVGNYWMLISRVNGYALDANGGNGKLYLSSQPRQDNKNQLWKVVDVNAYKAIGSALKN